MPAGPGGMPMGGAPMPAGPGGMPMGGAPMPGGGGGMGTPSNGAVTPQGMMAQADQIAQQLLAIPYEVRRTQMVELKNSDPALHALVKQRMGDIRSQAKSEGGQMVMQQQQAPM